MRDETPLFAPVTFPQPPASPVTCLVEDILVVIGAATMWK